MAQREEAKLVAIRGLSELASGFCRVVRSLRQDATLEVGEGGEGVGE